MTKASPKYDTKEVEYYNYVCPNGCEYPGHGKFCRHCGSVVQRGMKMYYCGKS